MRPAGAASRIAPRQVPLRDAEGLRAEGGATHAEAHVEGCAEDRHVDLRRLEILGGQRDWQLEECRDAEPGPAARLAVGPEQAGRALGVPGAVAGSPEVEARGRWIPEL